MDNTTNYKSTPIGSLIIKSSEEAEGYTHRMEGMPPVLTKIIFSPNTGAYVRGLSRTYNISEEFQPYIAFAILEITVGEKTFAQLATILSSVLQLPSDEAQKMAIEIEHDIFGPVKNELQNFLNSKKISSTPTAPTVQKKGIVSPGAQVQNLLDLKEIAAAKRQELLAAKPQQLLLSKEKRDETRKPKTLMAPPQIPRSSGEERVEPPMPPKFPLPPRSAMPPKPPTSPIPFIEY